MLTIIIWMEKPAGEESSQDILNGSNPAAKELS